jgi:hypothetical protein
VPRPPFLHHPSVDVSLPDHHLADAPSVFVLRRDIDDDLPGAKHSFESLRGFGSEILAPFGGVYAIEPNLVLGVIAIQHRDSVAIIDFDNAARDSAALSTEAGCRKGYKKDKQSNHTKKSAAGAVHRIGRRNTQFRNLIPLIDS